MIVFEIRNKAARERLLGYLFYYERSRRFFAEILDGLDEWEAPFMFSGLVKRGIYSIDSEWSGKFVRQRIIPPDRQNLGYILRENRLKQYDELSLLQLSEGRCAQDELYLVRIAENEIISSIRKRLETKVQDVMALKENRLLVFFRNGDSLIVDIMAIRGSDRLFGNVLSDPETFGCVTVSPGGNGVEWGEERFISAETLRAAGKKSEIAYDEVIGFIRARLCDSRETAALLNCSRQYISQLVDKEKLRPVRESANSNIYLKSAIERDTI